MKKLMFYAIGVSMFLCVIILLSEMFSAKCKSPDVEDNKLKKIKLESIKENCETINKKNIYKPMSLQVKSGCKVVLEIDHGLPPIIIPTEDMQKGHREGAQGAITLLVVDSTGKPVPDATVRGAFWFSNAKHYSFNVDTDKNGMVSLSDKCTGDLNFSIRKEGYYNTSLRYWFSKRGFDCAKDGRWLPWNPTVEVVLKEKRNPIPMYMKRVDLPMPARGEQVGFDFEVGDWVVPHGKGLISDTILIFNWENTNEPRWVRCSLSLKFSNPYDGAYLALKDEFSMLNSDYIANVHADYNSNIEYIGESLNGKRLQDKHMKSNEILVFRVRSASDINGNIQTANYGKIYGPLQFAQGRDRRIQFRYYFNPNSNDTNLEFDGVHNLIDPQWRGPLEPR